MQENRERGQKQGASPSDSEFVTATDLSKSFGSVEAVKDVSFGVAQGRMISLLGPSGCGKTTTLRCIAGLESSTKGVIKIGNEIVTDVDRGIELPPEKRSIGMVFQSYAVWPHMTVFQNVAFPLRVRKEKREKVNEKVNSVLDLVGLGDFGPRPATDLSGGQQQRVALARALVGEPRVVLFDEPLSNLDAKLREYMRVELKSLQERLGFTAIYVTHDQEEALAISDEMIIMNDGVIEQKGPPQEIYKNPMTAFVADFMGASNFLEGRVTEKKEDRYVMIELQQNGSLLSCRSQTDKVLEGMPVVVSFRPDACDLKPLPQNQGDAKEVSGTVKAAIFLGDVFEYTVEVGNASIRARLKSAVPIQVGNRVLVVPDPEKCILIPAGE